MKINKVFLLILLTLGLLQACKEGDKNAEEQQGKSSMPADSGRFAYLTRDIMESPNDPKLYLKRARAYDEENRNELAIRDMVKAVELDTGNAAYFHYLASLYQKRPYFKGAIESYERAVLLNPKDTSAFLELGDMYFDVKSRDKSFSNLNAALRLDPNNAKAFYYRGYNYRELGFDDKAMSNFLRVVELDPGYMDAYTQLGILYARLKDPRAEAYYTTVIRRDSTDLKALYARGMYYQEADSTAKAMKDYEAMLAIDGTHREANYNMGYLSFKRKEYKKSVEYFSKAIAADPEYDEAYYGRGLSLQKLGKAAEAKADLQKADELQEAKKKNKK